MSLDTFAGFKKVFYKNATCDAMAKIIEKTILAHGKKNSSTIGGKVMIVQIKPDNSIKWILNKPINPPLKSLTDFCKKYKEGKIKVTVISKDGKEKLKRLLDNYCPTH